MVDTCDYAFALIHGMYNTQVNPKESYGLGVKVMCPCKLNDCSQRTTLGQKVDSEGGSAYGGERILGTSVLSAQLWHEPKGNGCQLPNLDTRQCVHTL